MPGKMAVASTMADTVIAQMPPRLATPLTSGQSAPNSVEVKPFVIPTTSLDSSAYG